MANIQEGNKKSENDLVELINFLLFATDWKKGSSDQSDGMSTGQNVECACDCGCNLLLQNNTEDLDPEQLTLYSTDTDGIGVGNEKTGAHTLAATLKIPNSDLLVQIPSVGTIVPMTLHDTDKECDSNAFPFDHPNSEALNVNTDVLETRNLLQTECEKNKQVKKGLHRHKS